jgi:hypothetical protein
MSVEVAEFEAWFSLPDWNEKLISYSKKLSLSELDAHIQILKIQLERAKDSPNSLWVVYHHLIDRALMNIAMNLQNQQHNF